MEEVAVEKTVTTPLKTVKKTTRKRVDPGEKIIGKIRLNEKNNVALSFAPDLTLTKRKLEVNDKGEMEIVGSPEAEVKQKHLDMAMSEFMAGETNPVKRAIMAGSVFVIEGNLGVGINYPLIDPYEAHTKTLQAAMIRHIPTKVSTEIKEAGEAVKGEGIGLLRKNTKDILRALNPLKRKALDPDYGKDSEKEHLISLCQFMLFHEKDNKKYRPDLEDFLRETILEIDPNMGRVFAMANAETEEDIWGDEDEDEAEETE